VVLRPDRADFRNDLGVVLKKMGALDDAIEQYRIALKLEPGNPVARRNLESSLALKAAK
jgi:Flp pilus assembly protein TadD